MDAGVIPPTLHVGPGIFLTIHMRNDISLHPNHPSTHPCKLLALVSTPPPHIYATRSPPSSNPAIHEQWKPPTPSQMNSKTLHHHPSPNYTLSLESSYPLHIGPSFSISLLYMDIRISHTHHPQTHDSWNLNSISAYWP